MGRGSMLLGMEGIPPTYSYVNMAAEEEPSGRHQNPLLSSPGPSVESGLVTPSNQGVDESERLEMSSVAQDKQSKVADELTISCPDHEFQDSNHCTTDTNILLETSLPDDVLTYMRLINDLAGLVKQCQKHHISGVDTTSKLKAGFSSIEEKFKGASEETKKAISDLMAQELEVVTSIWEFSKEIYQSKCQVQAWLRLMPIAAS